LVSEQEPSLDSFLGHHIFRKPGRQLSGMMLGKLLQRTNCDAFRQVLPQAALIATGGGGHLALLKGRNSA
jgi:hypothetical protein